MLRKRSRNVAQATRTFAQGTHLVFDRRFMLSSTAMMIPKQARPRPVLHSVADHVLVERPTRPSRQRLSNRKLSKPRSTLFWKLPTISDRTADPRRHPERICWNPPADKKGNARHTSVMSRGHELFTDKSGLVTITGGKWTTYRRMAEDAVNKAADVARLKPSECVTAKLPITPPIGLNEDQTRLHPDLPYTHDDVVRAVRSEMAQTLEDVLARRRAYYLNAKLRSKSHLSPA